MPKVLNLPPGVRAFHFHGVELSDTGSGDEWWGECVFCGKEKFYASGKTSQWECKACGLSGNDIGFLRELWEVSRSQTPDSAYHALGAERGIPASELEEWGLCVSLTTGEWLLPGYGANGKLTQLHRWVGGGAGAAASAKRVWYATPKEGDEDGRKLGLFGVPLWSADADRVYVCEGVWDGAALRAALRASGDESSVVATPGCGTWFSPWDKYLDGREVVVCFDNDAGGTAGVRHLLKVLARDTDATPKDNKTYYVAWAGGRESVPDKYDVRDCLKEYGDGPGLDFILSRVKQTPIEWTPTAAQAKPSVEIRPENCTSWKELTRQAARAVKWHANMEGGLAVFLASVASVTAAGRAQLWFKLVSPPSSGKTILCEWVETASKYVVERSDFSGAGFFSGFSDAKKGEEKKDYSLAAKLFNRTLITKDGDPLLQHPAKGKILSQARVIYDMRVTKEYGHDVMLNYAGLRMTWVLCGTAALRDIDKSELGQRFLDWQIWDGVDEELEEDVTLRAIHNQMRLSKIQGNCKAETVYDKEYVRAAAMTGGYVQWLKENADAAVRDVLIPPDMGYEYLKLARFIGYLRARPVEKATEPGTREVAARLGEQLTRLAQFLAVVLQKDSVADPAVHAKVLKVALDTGRGRTMKIVEALDKYGPMNSATVALATGQDPRDEEKYLQFMRGIGSLEMYSPNGGGSSRMRWRMTPAFAKVWHGVMGGSEDNGEG